MGIGGPLPDSSSILYRPARVPQRSEMAYPHPPLDYPHESVLNSLATGVNDANAGASPGALEPYQAR
jgi:hypothetical protein